MVPGRIPTYRLRSDLLAAYFRTQFPGYTSFNIELSTDDSAFYSFETPEALTQAQKDYIDEHVRLGVEEYRVFS
ncbi:hypothetical protein C8A05DRAFT_14036 [Staphylotrichum tortipilum]|uniref:Uncharacterized protein n=1 Tax=Staphylotrichum tortipilum TaxID=2831512 RepID=A0AAN6RVJ0_9PEZI|nr:hypothetical protein C8A05DRAFT_14036 [Staphylotrichum longicolle]